MLVNYYSVKNINDVFIRAYITVAKLYWIIKIITLCKYHYVAELACHSNLGSVALIFYFESDSFLLYSVIWK